VAGVHDQRSVRLDHLAWCCGDNQINANLREKNPCLSCAQRVSWACSRESRIEFISVQGGGFGSRRPRGKLRTDFPKRQVADMADHADQYRVNRRSCGCAVRKQAIRRLANNCYTNGGPDSGNRHPRTVSQCSSGSFHRNATYTVSTWLHGHRVVARRVGLLRWFSEDFENLELLIGEPFPHWLARNASDSVCPELRQNAALPCPHPPSYARLIRHCANRIASLTRAASVRMGWIGDVLLKLDSYVFASGITSAT